MSSVSSANGMSRADRAGVWLSSLCVVHCVLTPVAISLSPVLAHVLPGEETTHRSLSVVVAAIGGIALLRGYRVHRRLRVLALLLCGLALIGGAAWFGDALPNHVCEVGVTLLGSALLIAAHRLNHTFCKDCACAAHTCG